MTQRETVLKMLEDAGERGVTTAQFLDARIPRFSARIGELRKDGHPVHTKRLREGSFLFTLVRQPPLSVDEHPEQDSGGRQVSSSVHSPGGRSGSGVGASIAAVASISAEAAENKGERVAPAQAVGAARLFELETPTGHHEVDV